MRNLSSQALTTIANKIGNEPISVIEIQWNGTSSWFYADRNISETDFAGYTPVPGRAPRLLVQGKVLEIGSLDNVVDLTHHRASSEINVKLDDTDGSIKLLMDNNDIHLKKVRLWQFFEGMNSFNDKFLVFSGHVASPVSWSEHDRTLSFNALSKLDDQEVGFSAEVGQFMFLPSDLVGKAWPMVFGTVMTYPALQINKAVRGILGSGVGIVTSGNVALWQANNTRLVVHYPATDFPDTRVAEIQLDFLYHCHFLYVEAANWNAARDPKAAQMYQTKADEIWTQINNLQQQIRDQIDAWDRQRQCREEQENNARNQAACRAQAQAQKHETQVSMGQGPNVVTILGGEDFPQDQQITLNIGGGYFVGVMHGTTFTIHSRFQPDNDQAVATESAYKYTPTCVNIGPSVACQNANKAAPITYHFEMQVPVLGSIDATQGGVPATSPKWGLENYVVEGTLTPPDHDSGHSDSSGGSEDTGQSSSGKSFWADAGSEVSIVGPEPMYYIASIVPGTVLTVQAYRTAPHAVRQLVSIPTAYYTVRDINYGPITAKVVILTQPLSSFMQVDTDGKAVSQGWEDTIYITYRSDVGPNIVDIVEYLIDTYTTLTWDATSFNACRTKLQKFPANFPILEKKNIVQLLEEIGYQSRTAIWLKDDVFYMKYLPEEPTSDATITESDVDFEKGITVEYTTTEDLVTRMNCSWHLNWGEKGKYQFILRHNVKKYGIKDDSYDFYMYNQPDIIYKVATFWMIRRSNTWKRICFSTFLNHLNLETFDTVTLNFGSRNYAANGNIKAVVEKATYNSDSNTVDFECLIPVKSGEMAQYPFFWPASLPTGTTFPTAREIAEGWAGGNSIGEKAIGTLPVGYVPTQGGTIIIGGINIGYGPHSDWGDRSPTDVGFTARTVVDTAAYSSLTASSAPRPILDLPSIQPTHVMISPYSVMKLPNVPLGIVGIDIHNTPVVDGKKQNITFLDSFFREVSSDGFLIGDTTAYWGDDEHNDADSKQFDFKFDDEGDMFGAGTAFLKPD